ncbi:multidrug efflux SMR transporter [Methylocystis sp. ATCC 49242]|uniref:DMT family transporter n=1 Tax=Methylocystis sp. ATCC 49242 TaxID=622637 RepID=UPI0001F8734F|nr:multidrug efflux SMR transporter [Methylocystis sp. ATCC 49242]
MPWLYLSIAILSEVVGTTALRAAEGFRNPLPTLVVAVGYGTSFYFLSLTLESIPMGVAYAIWSGVGVALISIAGWQLYQQALSSVELFGIALICVGVVILKFGGGH